MDSVAFDLGIIQIYWYSLCIFAGIMAAAIIITLEMKKKKIPDEFIVNLFFNTIIFGIIGARLYYVAFNLEQYLNSPLEILQIWKGGLAIHGGLIAGFLTINFYCRRHQVKTIKILDIIVVGLLIGQALGRWGNFFNQEAYGAVTSLEALKSAGVPDFISKGMYIYNEYRQPVFFYESIWNMFGFLALLMIRKYPYLKIGQLTSLYLVWYAVGRFVLESMRTDNLMLGNFKMAQIVSIIMFIIGIIIFFRKGKGSKLDNLYRNEEEISVNV